MPESDFLFTVAEIAAAFAGFSTLIVVVSERLSGTRGETVAYRLRLMLILCLITILFCLFPYLPIRFGLSSSAAWQVSSGAFGIVWFGYWCLAFRAIRERGLVRDLTRFNRFNLYGIHPAMVVVLLFSCAGLAGAFALPLYLLSVLVMLGQSGVLFLEQVWALGAGRHAA